ncbi:Cloroperoxidase [Dendrothele bispora CBS 962.96]|uniref:Cloroperoxidase n=1 Tax=Dendrothele bispora (strain CBS 962.96) TaxID=1314807 RepID=A0A4S8M0M3_DENBC|nr:Cloroperoxidase [Dendrothele bispora CBS 962.96]
MTRSNILFFFETLYTFTWDALLAAINLVTPSLKPGHIVPKGSPGEGGKWPEYIAPKEGDSRCACPALNALANHGILPRNGRNIPFKDMTHACHTSYNFSSSFSYLTVNYAVHMLKRNYNDSFDLEELNQHNGIEHDASLFRQDAHFDPSQAKPHIPYINELLSSSVEDSSSLLKLEDLAQFSAKRRSEGKASNPEFSLGFLHRIFGSSNSSTLLVTFGGHIPALRTFLTEERIPDGWESSVRSRKGLTFAAFNIGTVNKLESATEKYMKSEKPEEKPEGK